MIKFLQEHSAMIKGNSSRDGKKVVEIEKSESRYKAISKALWHQSKSNSL